MKYEATVAICLPKELKAALDKNFVNMSRLFREALYHFIEEGQLALPGWDRERIAQLRHRETTTRRAPRLLGPKGSNPGENTD